MEDLCTACLCSGRKLHYINDTGYEHLYSQIIREMPMYNLSELCVRVCWECKALLRKVGNFKDQVKRCYTELLAYVHQNSPKPFPNYPHLQIHQVNCDSYPQSIKEELEELPLGTTTVDNDDDLDVKSEETHCEPETFVNDLKVEKGRKKKVKSLKSLKKVDKPIKEKTKRKVKIKNQKATKKKTVIPKTAEVSQRINRTVDSIIKSTVDDCYNRQDMPEDDHMQDEHMQDEHMQDDHMQDDHMQEDDHKSEGDDIPEDAEDIIQEDVKKKEKVKVSNGIKLPKPATLSDKPVCSECGKTFSSRKTYRYHLNVLHKGQNRYPCPRCGKVYQWKSNLGRHIRSHKARDSGELYCELCDKRFASVATYRQHLRISRRHVSESEFRFTCNECGKKFVNKTRLSDHIDWEHLKKIKFECQICNKPFKCHTSLYVHLQNVHRSKDKRDNLCHVCGKSYQNAAKLKYHIVAMHTSETPYQCQQCNAAFGWYSSLYRHVREVHYKMKGQPKKSKKSKKNEVLPSLLPVLPQQLILPQIHQPGPA